ncbi:MAG: hypothetical protein WCW04_03350 [Candidatus Paceibacterota bacterium]
MNEGFNINKKIDHKEYRNDLADELREVIKESGFDEARKRLMNEKDGKSRNKFDESKYDKARDIKISQWMINKYLYNQELISDKKNLNLVKSKVQNKYIMPRIVSSLREKVFENNPNIEVLKAPHSDIILKPGEDNKYVLLETYKTERMFGKELLEEFIEYWSKLNEERSTAYKRIKETLDYKEASDILKESLLTFDYNNNQGYLFDEDSLSFAVIARPTDGVLGGGPFAYHKDIVENFTSNKNTRDITNEKAKFLEEELYEVDKYIKKVIKIIKEEEVWTEALDKVNLLPAPDFFLNINVAGGGYMELKDDGSVVISGKSDNYGIADKEKVVEILKNDFPEKKFIVN